MNERMTNTNRTLLLVFVFAPMQIQTSCAPKLQAPTLHTTDPTDLIYSTVGYGIYGTKGTHIIILNLARLARPLGCQAHILGAKTNYYSMCADVS